MSALIYLNGSGSIVFLVMFWRQPRPRHRPTACSSVWFKVQIGSTAVEIEVKDEFQWCLSWQSQQAACLLDYRDPWWQPVTGNRHGLLWILKWGNRLVLLWIIKYVVRKVMCCTFLWRVSSQSTEKGQIPSCYCSHQASARVSPSGFTAGVESLPEEDQRSALQQLCVWWGKQQLALSRAEQMELL